MCSEDEADRKFDEVGRKFDEVANDNEAEDEEKERSRFFDVKVFLLLMCLFGITQGTLAYILQ